MGPRSDPECLVVSAHNIPGSIDVPKAAAASSRSAGLALPLTVGDPSWPLLLSVNNSRGWFSGRSEVRRKRRRRGGPVHAGLLRSDHHRITSATPSEEGLHKDTKRDGKLS